jgi:hypothetical protein
MAIFGVFRPFWVANRHFDDQPPIPPPSYPKTTIFFDTPKIDHQDTCTVLHATLMSSSCHHHVIIMSSSCHHHHVIIMSSSCHHHVIIIMSSLSCYRYTQFYMYIEILILTSCFLHIDASSSCHHHHHRHIDHYAKT